MTNEQYVWDYLLSTGMSEYGVAGFMGNLYYESGVKFNILENLCKRKLKEQYALDFTDESYTAAVDDGTINKENFLHPIPGKQYGYGLCQWTTAERKEYLYDLVKERGVSIADPESQMDTIMHELETYFPSVWNTLKNAKSVKEASDVVLVKFEAPADKSDAVKAKRAAKGQEYYNMFHK